MERTEEPGNLLHQIWLTSGIKLIEFYNEYNKTSLTISPALSMLNLKLVVCMLRFNVILGTFLYFRLMQEHLFIIYH